MLLSMTGHGAAHRQGDGVSVTVDVRTINSRYYKLSVRASDGYGALEPLIDEAVRQGIRRGTVQVDLRIERDALTSDYRLNEAVLTGYRRQLEALGESAASIRLETLLALPGVVEEPGTRGIDTDSDWPIIRQTLVEALACLARMRADEGEAMAVDLKENCAIVRRELDQVEQRVPNVADAYRGRLTERINKLLAEFDVTIQPADVIREVALYAERSNVAEEIVRLRSHVEQFESIMQLPDNNGRKLEFVTQEMFREANTIGSKANDAEITARVIEIKAAIERIREMIQNVE